MRTILFVVVMLSNAVCFGQEPKRPASRQPAAAKTTVPPTQQVLSFPSGNRWLLTRQASKVVCEVRAKDVSYQIPVTVRKEVLIDGKKVNSDVTETRTETKRVTYMVNNCVVEQVPQVIDPQAWQAFDARGQRLSQEEVRERCAAKPTLIVVSGNHQMLDAAHAALFKPGTIVLVRGSDPTAGGAVAPVTDAAPTDVGSPAEIPAQPEPTFAHAKFSDGSVKLRQVSRQQKTAGLTVFANGEAGRQNSTSVEQTIAQTTITTIPSTLLRILSVQAQEAEPQSSEEALGDRERLVLMSANGLDVDPFWLQNIEPAALVLSGVMLVPDTLMNAFPAPPMPVVTPSAQPSVLPPTPAPQPATVPQPIPAPATASQPAPAPASAVETPAQPAKKAGTRKVKQAPR